MGAGGREGVVADLMYPISLNSPQPLKFYARYLSLYYKPLLISLVIVTMGLSVMIDL